MKEKGQSLTEMAVIMPLLLFMFLGLIEVGWAIRGYLSLLIADWNAARYGARNDVAYGPDYLDTVSHEFYSTVNLPIDDTNSTLHLTLVTFTTSVSPCLDQTAQVLDTITHTVGISTQPTIDIGPVVEQTAGDEAAFQCQAYERSPADWYSEEHQLLIVEAYYNQPQLLGFPLWSWLGDVPLGVQTKIRKL